MDDVQFSMLVSPARNCPHYITKAREATGAGTCKSCERIPVKQSEQYNRWGQQQRAVPHQRARPHRTDLQDMTRWQTAGDAA